MLKLDVETSPGISSCKIAFSLADEHYKDYKDGSCTPMFLLPNSVSMTNSKDWALFGSPLGSWDICVPPWREAFTKTMTAMQATGLEAMAVMYMYREP